MNKKESIAALLHSLDQRSPSGFAIALHIRFTPPTYLFQSYPKPWLDHYSQAGLVMHDPIVRWGLQNVGRLRWSDLGVDRRRRRVREGQGPRTDERRGDRGGPQRVPHDRLPSRGPTATITTRRCEELEIWLLACNLPPSGSSELSARDKRALTELSIKLTH